MIAGEASGDQLGAALIDAILQRQPNAQIEGVAGPAMVQAGCRSWHDADALAVMGVAEVIKHLPELLGLRRQWVERIIADPPDVVIGIDAPDFNLGLEAKVRAAGIATVHYVSPSVWAWRPGRVKGVRAAADLVLCLLPFEPDFYKSHGVHAEFVGHPLADEIPRAWDRAESRRCLGLPPGPLLAVLPGSRSTETSRLAPIFAATLEWLQVRQSDLRYVVPLAPGRGGEIAHEVLSRAALNPKPTFVEGKSREVMGAADAVLAASGTAVLEAALIKRPTVVAYRLAATTALLFRVLKLVDLEYYSLPNLLTEQELFPEFIQEKAHPAMLGPAVLEQLQAARDDGGWYDTCVQLHDRLARNASARAADLVLSLVQRKQSLARS